ncbi:MAG: hypothetical protein F9K30_07735 [Dechloromonas sp.]|nr:MAG: hypothetical protein F9K30_07735 [Dechloromonas sp.]
MSTSSAYIDAHVANQAASSILALLFQQCVAACEKHGIEIDVIAESYFESTGEWKSFVLIVEGEQVLDLLQSALDKTNCASSEASIVIVPGLPQDKNFAVPTSDLLVEYYRKQAEDSERVFHTDCNVRLTYLPSGIVVCCQRYRSRQKNYENALHLLKSRVSAAGLA